jgi:callose synthase
MIFLYILSLNAALVGMSLGILLPTLLPGICFGLSATLLVGAFTAVSNSYYLPVVGGVLAVVFGLLSAR